jgi:hypothetical protein
VTRHIVHELVRVVLSLMIEEQKFNSLTFTRNEA